MSRCWFFIFIKNPYSFFLIALPKKSNRVILNLSHINSAIIDTDNPINKEKKNIIAEFSNPKAFNIILPPEVPKLWNKYIEKAKFPIHTRKLEVNFILRRTIVPIKPISKPNTLLDEKLQSNILYHDNCCNANNANNENVRPIKSLLFSNFSLKR